MITGDSGSGKTLLAKALPGNLFYSGSVEFISNDKQVKPSILFVEQHYHFKNLSNVNSFYYQQRFNSFDSEDASTVEEELHKLSAKSSSEEKINSLLEKFDLAHRSQSPLLHLSSGEHKRFQLIRAVLIDPQILILDEPFVGLDVQSRQQLQIIINEMAANGTTFIIICDQKNAPSSITHIALLENGRLKNFSSKTEYFPTPEYILPYQLQNIPGETIHANFTKAVVFKNVSVSYGDKRILHRINWQVNRGDRWLLKGHNGAGKSTLLSLITGDNPQAYSNDIYLFDRKRGSGESIWDIKKQIGYVSPELQWYFDSSISCFEAVASGLFDTIGLFRVLNKSQEDKVELWLQYFDLEKHAHKLLSSLPAGRQRLTLLARAIVKNPPVLILDEPCQGLDQHQKDNFIQLTDSFCSNNERTLIYVSHYSEDVPSCVNKVLELKHGIGSIYSYTQKELIPA